MYLDIPVTKQVLFQNSKLMFTNDDRMIFN